MRATSSSLLKRMHVQPDVLQFGHRRDAVLGQSGDRCGPEADLPDDDRAGTGSGRELPPTYLQLGSVETLRYEDLSYARPIWAAGGSAELHVWPGGFHAFDLIAPESALARAALGVRLAWLRRITGR